MGVNAWLNRINDSVISYFNKLNLDDGTWSSLDSLGMIDSLTVDANGEHTVTLNTISNNSLRPIANSTAAPRWYKLATYSDGTPVLTNDSFIMTVVIDHRGSTAGQLRYFQHYLGLCENPTSTNPDIIKFNGGGQLWSFANTAADTTGSIIAARTVSVVSGVATDTHTIATLLFIGKSCSNTAVCVESDGDNVGTNANNFSGSFVASQQLYLMWMAGANGSGRSYSAGDQTKFNIKYKISRYDISSMGL